MSRHTERRRYPRVTLQPPLVGSVGRAAVIVLDASEGGFRVAHHSNLPNPGEHCHIEIRAGRNAIEFECVVVRTVAQPTWLSERQTELFQSGLEIADGDEKSRKRLDSITKK